MSKNKEVYIIAEAGVNHNGSIELAKQLVDIAADAGADAVKFQTYKTEDLVTKDSETAEYQQKNTGKKQSQYDMLKSLELSYDDFTSLKSYCDEKDIMFLTTAHTKSSIPFVNDLVSIFKVGSGDLTNIPYLEELAKRNKPIILSTGMGTMEEVKDAVKTIRKYHNNIVLLHCTTNYPCPEEHANLRVMNTLKQEFYLPVGYSDHTEGIMIPVMAASLGARLIEKHFTLDKAMEGPDHRASLVPNELKEMVEKIREEETIEIPEHILGNPEKKPTGEEKSIARIARKSVVVISNLEKGHILKEDDLAIKRPGIGIPPKEIKNLIGKITAKDIKKDSVLEWTDVE